MFEEGKKYWIESSDGSRILATAEEDKNGEFDLYGETFHWHMWASSGNLRDYKVTEV